MTCLAEHPTVVATCFVLITTAVVTGVSQARDLRPSYHGLAFQDSPPPGKKLSPEMKSFFRANVSNVALPKATNSSNTPWWRTISGGGDDGLSMDGSSGGRDHVRDRLLVASLACGITGVVILVVAGLLYVFKFRKEMPSESADKNKLQLVVRNP